MRPPERFTYYGITVHPHEPNSMGMRYTVLLFGKRLRAVTQEEMKELIRENLTHRRLRPRSSHYTAR